MGQRVERLTGTPSVLFLSEQVGSSSKEPGAGMEASSYAVLDHLLECQAQSPHIEEAIWVSTEAGEGP